MEKSEQKGVSVSQLNRYLWFAGALWTILIFSSLLFDLYAAKYVTLGFWFLGLVGILVGKRQLQNRIRQEASAHKARLTAETKLASQSHYLEAIVQS